LACGARAVPPLNNHAGVSPLVMMSAVELARSIRA
jgi:hypothetical protein